MTQSYDEGQSPQSAGHVNPGVVGSRLVDSLLVNREIAYRGKIGRRREQYCREQIRYMGVCHQKIRQDQLAYVTAKKRVISCGSGCSSCCVVYVGAMLQECEAIAFYLSCHESLLSNFLTRYPGWRAGVWESGDLFHRCEQLYDEMLLGGSSKKRERDFQDALERHNEQRIVCPFLINDLCSIYEVRPSNCAGLFVTHSPELCHPQGSRKPRFSLTSIDDVVNDVSFYYKTLAKPVTLYMPVAVYRLLEEGFSYLAQFPGIDKIESEAMADPEVQTILKSLYFSS